MDEEAVKQRVKELFLYYKETLNSFSKGDAALQKRLSTQINGETRLSIQTFLSIIDRYKDVSLDWLLKGEEPMIKHHDSKPYVESLPTYTVAAEDIVSYEKGKPYFDVPFKMGYDFPFNDNTSNPDYLIDFKPFNKCDFWCNCSGYSMYPTIASGDFVAMQIVRDFHLIVNNEIYGFVLKNGLRTIKRAKLHNNVFTLTPDNKDYEPQEVPADDVLCVYRVIGAVKVF